MPALSVGRLVLLVVSGPAVTAYTAVASTIQWEPQHRNFRCNSAVVLEGRLPAHAAEDVIVGFDADAKLGETVELALASVVPFAANPQAERRVFRDLSGNLKEVRPCTFDFSAPLRARERLVLHVRLKPDTRVSVQINGETWASLIVTRGALLHNGRFVTDRAPLFALRAAAVGLGRKLLLDGPELVRDGLGRLTITPVGFRQHLMETPDLKFASHRSPSDPCCEGATVVTFKVGVAPTGEIVLAQSVNVPAEHAERLERLVRALRLKPFFEGGSPVYAEGFLTLLLEKSGRISFLY